MRGAQSIYQGELHARGHVLALLYQLNSDNERGIYGRI